MRLEQRGRRSRVGVLAHGQRDDPRRRAGTRAPGRKGCPSRAARSPAASPSCPRVVATTRPRETSGSGCRRGDVEEEREVAPRIRADRDDVVLDRGVRLGTEVLRVHAERDELDLRSAAVEPAPKLVDLAPAVRDTVSRRRKACGEQPPRGASAKLREPLGESDRRVDDRRASPARAVRAARAGSRPCRPWRRRRRHG